MDALATTDEAKKQAIYERMQKTLWADAPWVFLVTGRNNWGAAKNLTGFNVMPDAGFDFYEMELK